MHDRTRVIIQLLVIEMGHAMTCKIQIILSFIGNGPVLSRKTPELNHCWPISMTGMSCWVHQDHYNDVIMGAIASQITSLTIVYSTVYSDADQRKHQSSASLAFVRGIHRGPVNSPHKWPVMRKMFPFDDVIRIGKDSSVYQNSFEVNFL